MPATSSAPPVRGALAALVLSGGLAVAALGGAGPLGPASGLALAAAGTAWLIGEWGLALRRARRHGRERERLEEAVSRLREEREEMESEFAELRSEQADLVNSARLATLGSLVAGVAHELHTPLGSLKSNHDTFRNALSRLQVILEDERVDEDELDEVRRIVRAVDGITDTNELAMERMIDLVRSLRTIGQPDASERSRVLLHEALDDTLRLLSHRIGDEITVEKDYGDPIRIECFPAELNQVFMNLLLNAAQAIEGEGRIAIRTRSDGERADVEIRDTGDGIPEEHLDRIFEPGFSTKGNRMGMGLGLLITRRVVDRHHGEIDVESEVGEGTSFTLRLPVNLPEEPEAETATPDGG